MTNKKIKSDDKKIQLTNSQKLQKISEEVLERVNWLKEKFAEVDPETKKKVAIGLGAAAAGLIALVGAKKSKK